MFETTCVESMADSRLLTSASLNLSFLYCLLTMNNVTKSPQFYNEQHCGNSHKYSAPEEKNIRSQESTFAVIVAPSGEIYSILCFM